MSGVAAQRLFNSFWAVARLNFTSRLLFKKTLPGESE